MRLLLISVFLLCSQNIVAQDNIICTEKFCEDYKDDHPCPELPEDCNIQNSTNSGTFLPFPAPCNCCPHCIQNLREGDFCSTGEMGGMVPDAICGPGLTCSKDEVCVKMAELESPSTECTKAQNDYDKRKSNGTIGDMEVRPKCDNDGYYQPFFCIPGLTCHCVDLHGNRIFGEFLDSQSAHFIRKCPCSRRYHDAVKFIRRELHPDEFFRCVDNGDYDTIQCIGEGCMCTDTADGAPTFPDAKPVNMSDISKDTLKDCFNADIHEEGKYFHECAAKYLEVLDEMKQYKKDGYDVVFEVEFPNCALDGRYGPVQKDLETQEAYCADPDGNQIGNYRVPLNKATDAMNCYCARSSLLLEPSPENPECCKNGNFNPVQCRRDICYCVDENGYYNNKEKIAQVNRSEVKTLSCYSKLCETA